MGGHNASPPAGVEHDGDFLRNRGKKRAIDLLARLQDGVTYLKHACRRLFPGGDDQDQVVSRLVRRARLLEKSL